MATSHLAANAPPRADSIGRRLKGWLLALWGDPVVHRAQARHIGRGYRAAMLEGNFPQSEIKLAIPYLVRVDFSLRSLLHRLEFLLKIGIPLAIFVLVMLFFRYNLLLTTTQSAAKFAFPQTSLTTAQITRASALSVAILYIGFTINCIIQKQFVVFTIITLYCFYISFWQKIYVLCQNFDYLTLWLSLVNISAVCFLCGFVIYIFLRMLSGVIWLLFVRRSPEAALVLSLARAYGIAAFGGSRGWRSTAQRCEIAGELRYAAKIIEGPMLRMLATAGGSGGEAAVRKRLIAVADALRSKLTWLATPKADTREKLARILGEMLLAAATGNLDRLGSDEGEPAGLTRTRLLARLAANVRWVATALSPAMVLWFAWDSVPSEAKAPAVQLSAAWAIVNLVSLLGPSGRDNLSTALTTGTTLSGWGKGKT